MNRLSCRSSSDFALGHGQLSEVLCGGPRGSHVVIGQEGEACVRPCSSVRVCAVLGEAAEGGNKVPERARPLMSAATQATTFASPVWTVRAYCRSPTTPEAPPQSISRRFIGETAHVLGDAGRVVRSQGEGRQGQPSTCSFFIPGPIEQGPERLEMLCPSCSDRPARTAMAVG